MRYWIFITAFFLAPGAFASGAHVHLDAANVDLNDRAALQRGAKTFVDYCVNCHSAAYMRYNRIGEDLGIPEEEVVAQLIKTASKVGDTMTVALDKEDGKRWFGNAPPDLSVEARARGADWLYTYLRSFYRDESRPWGVNNTVFKDVAMPHVLWELQGLQEPVKEMVRTEDGKEQEEITGFKLVEPGKLSPKEYDATVHDLVSFLVYLSEPSKLQRLPLGKWVLLFLAVMFVLTYLLKKEYWKDIH